MGLNAQSTQGSLPSTGGLWACISSSCTGGWASIGRNSTVDTFLQPYLFTWPIDPPAPSRTNGGYMYINSRVAAVSPYDGSTFPAGAYLNYMLEPVTLTSGVCGQGRIWNISTLFINCLLKLD